MNQSPDNNPSVESAPPTKRPGFFRRLFSWVVVRRFLFAGACFVTFIIALLVEETWRGKSASEQYKRQWEAKGEKFDLRDFVPPPVPDDQNFAMTPFLAPLFDFNRKPLEPGQSLWRDTNGYARVQGFASNLFAASIRSAREGGEWHKSKVTDLAAWALALRPKANGAAPTETSLTRPAAAAELLQDMEEYQPVLEELRTASQRPSARFNVNYLDEFPPAILLPHLSNVKKLGAVFQLRAEARLAAGRTDEALADTKMVVYLSGTIKQEPFLICGLVRAAMLQMALQPVWEGLAGQQWRDSQLAQLEEELGKVDMVAEGANIYRGERALNDATIAQMRGQRSKLQADFGQGDASPISLFALMPAGWLYQNELAIDRLYQEFILPAMDPAAHRIDPAKVPSDARIQHELQSGFPPYKIFAKLMVAAIASAEIKFAQAQSAVDEARVACALERYRLANGQYPETLDALSPAFIQSLPHDVINGEPLKYRVTESGQFILYSVGWNRTDEGGQTVMTSGSTPNVDYRHGDWVWPQYPVK